MSEPDNFARLADSAARLANDPGPAAGVPAAGVPAALDHGAVHGTAASPRVGLVLAGGGAKGAYELGVLDFLAELGMRVTAIAGTSIGALNGAVLASEPTLLRGTERLARFWERFATQSGVAPFADRGLEIDDAGLAVEPTGRQLRLLVPRLIALRSRVGLLEQLVDEAVDFAGIRTGRPLWVVAYPLLDRRTIPPRLRRVMETLRWLNRAQGAIIRLNSRPEAEIREAVLASAALPFLFPARVVDCCAYLDGGLGGRHDRTPVRAFAEREHCDVVLVIHLHPGALPPANPPNGHVRVDIRPSVPIAPPGALGPLTALLAFSPERVQALRTLGYRDAKARFTEVHRILTTNDRLTAAESIMLSAIRHLRESRT